MQQTPRLKPWGVLTLFSLALACALAAGLLQRQIRFDNRGIFSVGDPIHKHKDQNNGPGLGLVVSLEQYDRVELDENLSQIASFGFETIRQSYFYAPDFDWSLPDAHFEALANHPSLTLVPMLDGDPNTAFSPIDPNVYAAWAAEFATRYGDQIDHYIIWDEPNITTHWGMGEVNPQSYAALLSAASVAIKTADPTAQIVLAPLAPTTENNLINMTEVAFLEAIYGAGAADAFDIVAVKPYGFDLPPTDRTVDPSVLNFSRPVLVRELLVAQADGGKEIWAGNFGWNRLDDSWGGDESPWESVPPIDQERHTAGAIYRATTEWPWMTRMYLHHWEPIQSDQNDPIVGFRVKGLFLGDFAEPLQTQTTKNGSGFYPAGPELQHTDWIGDWRFSPDFGADMSQKSEGDDPDQVIFIFEGSEVGLQVRRANYRARFNILIDGEPANALPHDDRTAEYGSALVLNTNNPDEDQIETILVASGLTPGQHQMVVTGHRGWDQWALKGFVVGNRPDQAIFHRLKTIFWWSSGLLALAGSVLFQPAGVAPWLLGLIPRALKDKGYLWLTSAAGLLVSLTGWLIWGTTPDGIFRRMGDGSQLLFLFGTALVFYVTPWLPAYALALLFLFLIIYQRPLMGLLLISFSIPFYVPQLLKPIYVYRFSPVETFTLITFGAMLLRSCRQWLEKAALGEFKPRSQFSLTDWAVLLLVLISIISLAFSQRLDVATNELRTVIIGPALFYWMLRRTKPTGREINWILLAFVTSGLLVALIGLGQYFIGNNLITAEGGLQRLRSIYGSPNNVALYLGRIYPLLFASLLAAVWQDGFKLTHLFKKPAHLVAWIIITLAILLSFSRGGILIGLPVATAMVFILWQRRQNRPVWPWLAAGLLFVVVGYFAALQLPALAGRLDFGSQTAGFRIDLWQSSLQIVLDHPLTGVGLDNFLYSYRNTYILARAWQEPNLNHPHNHIFDFMTRLGIPGLIAGVLLFWGTVKNLFSRLKSANSADSWSVTAGLLGAIGYALAHGLVDHSFFLIDLAYSTLLIAALSNMNLQHSFLDSMHISKKSG